MIATTHRRLFGALLTLTLLGAAAPMRPDTIIVTTTAELEAALAPANAGAHILVRAGDYDLSHALTVPDDATLVGEGVMSFDESGLPAGMEASGRTLLRATTALAGDLLTLGDGATIQGLVIEDVVGRLVAGNLVAVYSRAAGDFISATIVECELINPNPPLVAPQGSTGRGLAVVTLNPNLSLDPPAHEGAVLWAKMTRSIVRSPGTGVGVFAINFASHAEIRLDLEGNVVGGGLSASAGVGRPDAVTGAAMIVQSKNNLYRSDSPVPTAIGWTLFGGADAPSPIFVSGASTFNALRIHSNGDRIEGFATGIAAAGGRRFGPLSAPISSNSVDMNLHGTQLQTTAADLTLFGARSFVAGVYPDEGNTLHLVVRQANGSGARANQYADALSTPSGSLGPGNLLEIVGSQNAFVRTNDDIDPIPPAEFFTK